MVWKDYIVKQFDIINRSGTQESGLVRTYNTLLLDVFPPAEYYQVTPQIRRNTESMDYTVFHIVSKSKIPIFFVEIKTFVALDLHIARHAADDEMRDLFLDLSQPLPQSKLIGISAMGTRFAVYEYTTNDRRLIPPRIIHHPGIVPFPECTPKERWSDNIMEDSGEAKFKVLVNEAKEMASAFGEHVYDICDAKLYHLCGVNYQ